MDEHVKERQKVGIYGNQLVLSAIGASLQEKAGFDVQRTESLLPGTAEQLDPPPDVMLRRPYDYFDQRQQVLRATTLALTAPHPRTYSAGWRTALRLAACLHKETQPCRA